MLIWSKSCVITDETTKDADPNAIPPAPEIIAPTGATPAITDAKLYISVVTLSSEDDDKLLEQLKTGFKRKIKWNRYRSEMTTQAKTNKLNYLIDPAFSRFNRLFVLSLKNEEDRTSFLKYYTPEVEIKEFNHLIDGSSFFDVPIKNTKETYKKIIEMSKNYDYTTGNLLNCDNFSNHYKLIAKDLSQQIEL